ncbi:hypothetical protein [Dokdonia sp. PRO95]|uniref:hypothetical protein n=1 Tax=Dokdonia sp. PRO95 TaxID=1239415 RepID=UPI000550BE49|nr:hypothetical protein [Dokdonia sp. PRO95]
MNKPILLLREELLNPIEQALTRIEKIRKRKINNSDSIILEGLFALGVSSFEHALIDTLRTLFLHIPDKLDLKTEVINKDQLINGIPLNHAIENKVNGVSYKNISDILEYFASKTGINSNLVSKDEIDRLLELKATRNLLIHNNLIVNSIYDETAGPNKRNSGDRLTISQNYLFESIVVLRNILNKFKVALEDKYKTFTKINATKNLFNYIFTTPIMDFENEFNLFEDQDRIGAMKTETSQIGNLSSSETLLFKMWLAHSHNKKFDFKDEYFFRLDNKNRGKLAFLIKKIDLLKP